MYDIKQKLSYLRGLMEGMEISGDSKDGKVFAVIVDIIEDMVDEIEELQEAQEEIEEYLDNMDEDLSELEEDFYDDEDDELDPDEDYVEVVCSDCGDIVCFESSVLDDEGIIEITCPSCEAVVFINDEDVYEDEKSKED